MVLKDKKMSRVIDLFVGLYFLPVFLLICLACVLQVLLQSTWAFLIWFFMQNRSLSNNPFAHVYKVSVATVKQYLKLM